MMNKLFFIVFSVLSAIFAFSSCTKNDYEEALATEMSKSRMTRAAYSITMEEVQERLDELNNIYKTNWIIDKTCDANCYNDSFSYNRKPYTTKYWFRKVARKFHKEIQHT